MNKRPLLLALGLGIATWLLFCLVQSLLPYSYTWGVIKDWLAMPGAFLASFFYPEGIHSDCAAGWPWLVIFSNIAVYIFVWYGALRVIALLRRRRTRQAR